MPLRFTSIKFRNAVLQPLSIGVILGGAAGLGTTVHAQDAEHGKPRGAEQSGKTSQLEEIIVTARRRAENLQDVPATVTVFTNQELEVRRVVTPDDIILTSPGTAFFALNKLQPEYNIRGVHGAAQGSSLESSVLTVIDEVPISKDILRNPAMFDMQRVEVMKGPQGTAFGRNASGGVVHLVSRRPESGAPGGKITAGVGSHGLLETDGFFNVPISDNAAGRIAYHFNSHDGYTESASTGEGLDGQQNTAIRASLLFEPTSAVSLYLKAEWNKDEDDAPVNRSRVCGVPQLVDINDPVLSAQFPLLAPWTTTYYDPCDKWKTEISEGDWSLNREMINLTSELSWELQGGITLRNVLGFVEGETDRNTDPFGTPEHIFGQRGDQKAEVFSEEIRIDNHARNQQLRWVAGLSYLTDKHRKLEENIGFRDGSLGFPFVPTFDTVNSLGESESYGVLGELGYDLSDQLTVTLGARWSRDEKDYSVTRTGYGFGAFIEALPGCDFPNELLCGDEENPVGYADPVRISDAWEDLMLRASVDYRIAPDHMVYALYSEGYKSGGFQPLPPTPESAAFPIDKETSDNYEIGWKGEFGGRARFGLTAFYLSYSDLQLTQFIPTSGGFLELVDNAADTRSYGIEGEGLVRITDNFQIQGSFAIQEAEFRSDIFPPGDTKGIRLGETPKWTVSLSPSYDFNLANGSTVTLRGDYRGRSDFWFQFSDRDAVIAGTTQKATLQPETHVFDASLTWTSANASWRASIWGKNLTEEEEVFVLTPSIPLMVQRAALYGPPRTFGAAVGYEF